MKKLDFWLGSEERVGAKRQRRQVSIAEKWRNHKERHGAQTNVQPAGRGRDWKPT